MQFCQKASFELCFTDPKQKIQVEVQGNNLNFLLFYALNLDFGQHSVNYWKLVYSYGLDLVLSMPSLDSQTT